MLHSVKHIIALLLTAVLLTTAAGQQARFRVTHYDETSGLQSNVINTMLQDKKGYMWFGTADGLCRFDGYTFKTFRRLKEETNSLPGNNILKLAEDGNGKLWIGLMDAISCYDPATGIFTNYPIKNIDSSSASNTVSMLFIDKRNNVWAGLLQKGLIRLNKSTNTFAHYDIVPATNTFYSKEIRSSYNNIYDMYEQGHGIYWLATHDGLYRFNANTTHMQPVRAKPLDKRVMRDDLYLTMAADSNGLWLGSWAGGLSYYHFKSKQWLNYKFDNRSSNVATTNIIHQVKYGYDKELWVASNDRGIGAFDTATKHFDFCSDDSAVRTLIPAKFCGNLFWDRQKNLWLSYPDGLYKIQYFDNSFKYIPVKVSRSDNDVFYEISCMFEDREGNYLFTGTGFADGLHITDKHTGKTKTLTFKVMPIEESIYLVTDMMQDTKGNIWVLTRDYVYQYDRAKNKLIAIPQPPVYTKDVNSNHLIAIKEDKHGNVWIASTRNGIFCYDPGTKKYNHFYNSGQANSTLPSNVITALATDGSGRIWAGGPRGCFAYFDESSGKFINLQQQAGNTHTRIHALYTDKSGNIWAGSDAELYYYTTSGKTPKLEKTFSADNGLRGDVISSIHEDGDHNIWCITNAALCKINNQTNNIVTYGRLDGIDKTGSLYGMYLLQSNNMALFSTAGYYVFNPSLLQKKVENVPLAITSFKIDDREQFFENTLKTHRQMVVPASANVISFEFAALDFNRPNKQQYAYKLQGFDKDWIIAGQRRYAGYANIPGGDYVFKVKATTTDSWNVPEVSIPVHIIQPFYKTWWFIAAVVTLFLGAVYLFYRFKLIKQQQILLLETKAQVLEKEKALVMYESLKQQLNPHFLFNSLTSLSSLIQYNQQKATNFLEGLSKIYRYILKSRDNETVTLVEEKKFIQTFVQLQQTRFDHGLLVNIDIPKGFEHCKIAPVTLQNLIENAIKHNVIDEDSPLTIDIYTEDGYIVTKNNLQRKNFVETSNKQGLNNLISLYYYLSHKPVIITENEEYFFVKIPML